jgi:hypothetical protein
MIKLTMNVITNSANRFYWKPFIASQQNLGVYDEITLIPRFIKRDPRFHSGTTYVCELVTDTSELELVTIKANGYTVRFMQRHFDFGQRVTFRVENYEFQLVREVNA